MLLNYHKDVRELGVNGSLRLNATLMVISNDIKPDLLPNVSLKRKALIIKRQFRQSLRNTLLESSWR